MAVAARKLDNERRYAPAVTRVYAQGAAAPALEPEERAQPKAPPRQKANPARATRIARAPQKYVTVNPGKIMITTLATMAGAALMILILVRYAIISQEYSMVNDTREQIAQSGQEIAALKVQLNAAVSMEDARAAALAAGMGYPSADQIVRIQGDNKAQTGGQSDPE